MQSYDDWKCDPGPWPDADQGGDEPDYEGDERNDMKDETEDIRREHLVDINTGASDRAALEAEHGAVYDTDQMREHFEVVGFLAPYVVVLRRSDGVKGTLAFRHNPRLYFNFVEHKE
jgi:hypothetical protein